MRERLIDELLKFFISENDRYKEMTIPNSLDEKRLLLRALINVRRPLPINDDILKKEDELLTLELKEKNITDVNNLEVINRISLWRGDITTLKIDAIVNACNSYLLGCFVPNHSCIDNQIHTNAGIRLRLECDRIMNGKEEENGKARITPGYNLPCKYVLHTVGPIVRGKVTLKNAEDLRNCLNLAKENGVKTIAFPSISTGVFHYPKKEAAHIAVETVKEYLKNDDSFDAIIFNVFSEEDEKIYMEELNGRYN